MADQQILANDVQRGIDVLNRHGPNGWADNINLDDLNIESCDNCILGQLYGSYADGMQYYPELVSGSYNYGFAGQDHRPIWKARIRELRTVDVPERELVTV